MDKQIAAHTSLAAHLQTLGGSAGSAGTEQKCVSTSIIFIRHVKLQKFMWRLGGETGVKVTTADLRG